MLRCNLPLALFGRMTGVFYVPLRYHREERAPNQSQHTKLTLEKNILPPLLPGFELVTFRSRIRCSTKLSYPEPLCAVDGTLKKQNKPQLSLALLAGVRFKSSDELDPKTTSLNLIANGVISRSIDELRHLKGCNMSTPCVGTPSSTSKPSNGIHTSSEEA